MNKKVSAILSRDPERVTLQHLMLAKNEILLLLILDKVGKIHIENEEE